MDDEDISGPGGKEEKAARGIQSVETSSQLLSALARHPQPMALGELARAVGITAGKAHPYMVSFAKVGFVTQQPGTGRYELGPLALQLGLARLQRLDPVKEASPLIADLAAEIRQGVALAVWGTFGPTIVRMEEPGQPLHVNMRIGTVMSLVHTATGRLFAAYMAPAQIADALALDDSPSVHPARKSGRRATPALQAAALEEIRRHGLSRTRSQPIPGIDALCAPVFDSAGHLVLGVLALGPTATFDTAWDGPIATALKRCAAQVSHQLGYQPAAHTP
ncbi:IclR family transcriptional regulator [Xylophilus sp.]|uniref:IclR family transcriptional regulator n=1 Tax=Xylophilus sp. TaxID=2653893 RepID=UPI0013B80C01|nr:IclR family transcriptional regulator [Xylophilus sp.]KAF1045428.1 MAG: Glycerol operon regulatory protein [Xylophilus sp.]